jgi:diguanylate cyclase (GGDEF)-like protein
MREGAKPAFRSASVWLRDHLREHAFAIRMALLGLAFALPIVGAASILVHQDRSAIALTTHERIGVGYSIRNENVLHELRIMRDRVTLDGGDGVEARRHVQVALDELYAYDGTVGRELYLTKSLARFQMRWATVAAGSNSVAEIDSTVDSAVRLFYYIDTLSYLNSDPDRRTSALIDALGSQIPALQDRLDRAKVILLRRPTASTIAPTERIRASSLIGQARWALALANADVSAATRDDRHLRAFVAAPMHGLSAGLHQYEAAARKRMLDSHDVLLAEMLRSRGDAAGDAAFAAHNAMAREVDRFLSERLGHEQSTLLVVLVGAICALLVGLGIVVQTARTIRYRDRAELYRAQATAAHLAAELDRRRAVEQLTVSEARFRAVFDGSSLGVAIIARDGTLVKANTALREMFGDVDPAKIGAAHGAFAALVDGRQEAFVTETVINGSAGPCRWFDVSVSLVRDDDGRPLFAMSMVKDVTDRIRTDQRLRYDATHDVLSGLPNRAYFLDQLRDALAAAGLRKRLSAVLFVDLDEFKFINDSLGHTTGDKVLVATAHRLQEASGAHDVVARLGGDEFALLAHDRSSLAEIDAFVEEVQQSFARPLNVDGRDIFVTASIGVALVERSYAEVEEILRDADTAMYQAKSAGRARHAFFNRTMHAEVARRLELATELRFAIERGEFSLAYQPIVSLTSGRVESYEALLRWEHNRLGTIAPVEFIPLAEDIGLIVPIGRMVLDRACADLARWKRSRACDPRLRVNVNASVREIVQPDYGAYLAKTIDAHGLRPTDVVIEVTEGGILTSGKLSDAALRRIKAVGVGLSIDDFGTGYSSLRYVQQFPFDEFKIDRSFIAGANGAIASEAIVSMLLSLGRALSVSVVAEGVETAAQAARLRALGCARAQGYFFGVPSREVTFQRPAERIISAVADAR